MNFDREKDIVIGLTILAFRYEGLRESDFLTFMKDIQQKMWNEEGAYPNTFSSHLTTHTANTKWKKK